MHPATVFASTSKNAWYKRYLNSWKVIAVVYLRKYHFLTFAHTSPMSCKSKWWGKDQTTSWPASSATLTTMGFTCSCIYCFTRFHKIFFNSPWLTSMLFVKQKLTEPCFFHLELGVSSEKVLCSSALCITITMSWMLISEKCPASSPSTWQSSPCQTLRDSLRSAYFQPRKPRRSYVANGCWHWLVSPGLQPPKEIYPCQWLQQ